MIGADYRLRRQKTKPMNPSAKRPREHGSGIVTYLSLLIPTELKGLMVKSHSKAQVTSPGPAVRLSFRVSVFPSESFVKVLLKKAASPWLAPGVTTVSVS